MTKKISKTTKEVMTRIKSDKLKMKPRVYFVLGSMLLGSGIVGVLLITVFLSGAIFFRLRVGEVTRHLRQGMPGLIFFVRAFPWKVVGLAILSFWSGSWMLRKHSKVYKVGLLWLVLGAVVTVIGLGLLMDRVGINERLGKVKGLKPLYRMRSVEGEEVVRPMMRRVK